MMRFDGKYFSGFKFTDEQVKKNFDNALKDLHIAEADKITEVKFSYAYQALIKGGIALIGFYGRKAKSLPGHHVKIIEAMANILEDDTVEVMGNAMRSKRNLDFYGGGIEVTEKESIEYLGFVTGVLQKIKKAINV